VQFTFRRRRFELCDLGGLRRVAEEGEHVALLRNDKAVAVGHFAESLLYGLKGYDSVVLGGSAIALTLVALGAGFIPAMRASQIEPMTALRYE